MRTSCVRLLAISERMTEHTGGHPYSEIAVWYIRRKRYGEASWRCLRRGTFHRRKVPKMRRGLRPPVPRWTPRRASSEEALRRQLLSSELSCPLPPTPSRLRTGQWNRSAVTATGLFSNAAPTAPEHGETSHTAALHPLSHGFAVTAPLTQGSFSGCKPTVLRMIFPFLP